MNEMINHFKPGSPVSSITKEGTVNNIYIYQNSGRLVKSHRWFNYKGRE